VNRARCRVCRFPRALTRRGLVWHHYARTYAGPVGRCSGAGLPPLGRPGPAVEPDPGQVVDASPLVRAYPGGTIYLLHLDEPFGHAKHYTGWASDLHARLAHHAAGTGANLLRHVAAAGIGWTLVRTWPGDRREERRLKRRGGASDRCPVCRPGLEGFLLARAA
jgi:predicted GIY-YIG superfamily endonuclease